MAPVLRERRFALHLEIRQPRQSTYTAPRGSSVDLEGKEFMATAPFMDLAEVRLKVPPAPG